MRKISPEFELIRCFFYRENQAKHGVMLENGDDCALVKPLNLNNATAISTDLLIEDRHFFSDVDPFRLGHKALAVNLSDLASMGAVPRWYTLSLGLPKIDLQWLEAFSLGLHQIADRHQLSLIGGDATSSPIITINISIFGEIDTHLALKRSGAKIGDDIWVSGELGGASLALKIKTKTISADIFSETQINDFINKLEMPTPRSDLGQCLSQQKLAHSAIDISDGIFADLDHILELSHVGAELFLDQLPIMQGVDYKDFSQISGGDDYELCFTGRSENYAQILNLSKKLNIKLTKIGKITENLEYKLIINEKDNINLHELNKKGYDHFI